MAKGPIADTFDRVVPKKEAKPRSKWQQWGAWQPGRDPMPSDTDAEAVARRRFALQENPALAPPPGVTVGKGQPNPLGAPPPGAFDRRPATPSGPSRDVSPEAAMGFTDPATMTDSSRNRLSTTAPQPGASYGSQNAPGAPQAWSSPQPEQPAATGTGELENYKQSLIRQINASKRARSYDKSIPLAQKQAMFAREQELNQQIWRANRVMAGDKPQQTPEQYAERNKSLQDSYGPAVAAIKGQNQGVVDVAKQRVDDARNFFLTKPTGTEEDFFAGLRALTPGEQSLGPVNERAAIRAAQQAQQAQADYNPPAEYTPLPYKERAPVDPFDRQQLGTEMKAWNDSRANAAALERATEEEALAKSQMATEGYRAGERTAKAQTPGMAGVPQTTEDVLKTREFAETANAMTLKGVETTAENEIGSLEQLGITNANEAPDRIKRFRDVIVAPLQAHARSGDRTGAAAAAGRIIARLRATVAKLRPGAGSAFVQGATGANPGPLYAALAASVQKLIDELTPLTIATPTATTPPEPGPPSAG